MTAHVAEGRPKLRQLLLGVLRLDLAIRVTRVAYTATDAFDLILANHPGSAIVGQQLARPELFNALPTVRHGATTMRVVLTACHLYHGVRRRGDL